MTDINLENKTKEAAEEKEYSISNKFYDCKDNLGVYSTYTV